MNMSSKMYRLLQQFRTALRFGKKYGIRALVALCVQKVQKDSAGLLSKTSVINHYDFVNARQFGFPINSGYVPRSTITWVIPPFGYGSGGHLNIFRFIHFLEKEGFDCRIVVVGKVSFSSAEQAYKQINEWFFPVNADVYLGMESAPPSHITIATSWQTAYYVRNFLSTVHRCYFVQDYEPYFYAAGSEYIWAEETYRFGFFGITAGTWLKDKLISDFGMRAEAFCFAYDKHLYHPVEHQLSSVYRVFFYARPPTQRRAFEMGMLVLNEVVRRLLNVEVVFAGWDVSCYQIPFNHKNLGICSLDELPNVYRECDVALVLSFTNLSLLPLELMASGVPLVSNRAPCTEWLLNDENARLAIPTVDALADAVCEVLENTSLAQRLKQGGFATAQVTDWEREASKVGAILRNLDCKKEKLE